ncbi:hypothetical protein [Streptomyces sp. NBC_01261]|uniref:hypothetical protein n=1 Tax=Streptomyces sp. NBC_01261 TaxID=2903802 RepID=UPI003FCD7ED9
MFDSAGAYRAVGQHAVVGESEGRGAGLALHRRGRRRSGRRFKGYGVGRALLAHAGDDRKLVAYDESNGFTATEAFVGNDRWPGQVPAWRV